MIFGKGQPMKQRLGTVLVCPSCRRITSRLRCCISRTTRSAMYGAAESSCTSCCVGGHHSTVPPTKKLCAESTRASLASPVNLPSQPADPEWSRVSDEAKTLISKLLTYDPAQRITAAEALADPWIARLGTQQTQSKSLATGVLKNLSNFRVRERSSRRSRRSCSRQCWRT